MKTLITILVLIFCKMSYANDMLGVDFNVGQNSVPTYGIDYEYNRTLPYVDLALSGNTNYFQPYLSAGLQYEIINFGLAVSMSYAAGETPVFLAGAELGFMYNLSSLIYVKENNNVLSDMNGNANVGATVSIGLNL